MRLPRPRVSLWLLMVIVALTAVATGGWVLRQRAREYQKRADLYARMELYQLQMAKLFDELASRDFGLIIGEDVPLEAHNELVSRQSAFVGIVKKSTSSTGKFVKEQAAFTERREESTRRQEAFLKGQKERVAEQRKSITENEAGAVYYATLKRKYQQAASRPWLAPRPDPPPPSVALRINYWLARRDYRRALDDIDELLKIHPEFAHLQNLKAWTLATCPEPAYRDGKRAVEAATRACELSEWKNPNVLDTLAAAYAEVGDFQAAIRWQTEALDRQAPNSPERPGFKARLALYQQAQPCREEPGTE